MILSGRPSSHSGFAFRGDVGYGGSVTGGLGWVTLSQKDRGGTWSTTSVPANPFFSFSTTS